MFFMHMTDDGKSVDYQRTPQKRPHFESPRTQKQKKQRIENDSSNLNHTVGESEYDYSNYDLTVPSSGDEYTQCDSQAETQRI